jgi:hypothetical protein
MYQLKSEILTHWKDTYLRIAEVEDARKGWLGCNIGLKLWPPT